MSPTPFHIMCLYQIVAGPVFCKHFIQLKLLQTFCIATTVSILPSYFEVVKASLKGILPPPPHTTNHAFLKCGLIPFSGVFLALFDLTKAKQTNPKIIVSPDPTCWLALVAFVVDETLWCFFQGTTEETQALIAWRAASGNLFTGRRNSSINGWQ